MTFDEKFFNLHQEVKEMVGHHIEDLAETHNVDVHVVMKLIRSSLHEYEAYMEAQYDSEHCHSCGCELHEDDDEQKPDITELN